MPVRRRILLQQAVAAAFGGAAAFAPPPSAESPVSRGASHRAAAFGDDNPATAARTQAASGFRERRRRPWCWRSAWNCGASCRPADEALPRGNDPQIPTCSFRWSSTRSFARRHRATLFVSLHANAAHDHHASGACVYRFATRASDAAAAAMARWENSADRYGDPTFRDASPALAHILASLMRRETWRHSAELQRCMVDRLDDRVAMVPVAARHASFIVLSAPPTSRAC